ncbi:hypothetical protein ACEK06_11290 [Pseudomonas brenneri]|uniref:hypothetical protein n=1 Tax=Pseudomonas brenneri TaxID=129817 RepID=UPI0035715ABA
MPTHHDETLPLRYEREHQAYLKLCGSMTAEQVADLQLQLNNSMAREQALQALLTAADERVDLLEGLVGEVLDAVGREPLDLDAVLRLRARMRAALKPAEVERNQCDGCQAGIPVVNGAHRMGKPDGYPDTMSCTAKMYVEERPDGCCCPPKGHTGLWAAALCPVHQGLRALKR